MKGIVDQQQYGMRSIAGAIVLLFLLLLSPLPLHAQDRYEIDLSEIEKKIERVAKKPYSLTGFLEFEPILFGLDRDSAFYRLQFFDRDEGDILQQYNFGLRLEGSYRQEKFSIFARSDTFARYDYRGWEAEIRFFEGFASLKPNLNVTLEAGKKVIKWGKGFAWNPVSFVDRPKNPEDPDEALEGFFLLTADLIRSFEGPLKTVALTPVILPVYEGVNEDFGETGHVNVAVKLYLLLSDTDIDFMIFTGESRTTRYGIDFAKNLKSNVEIHGEWALITNFERPVVNDR
ncbi:MAG: hypothetical protein HY731_00365, partial [Candidatus Tectomicrobia bacterium]|nr:hypothetical protein [Candidatus Tectomicrobia bacterium]